MALRRGKDRIRRHPCIEGVTLVKTAKGQNVWIDDADATLLEGCSVWIAKVGYPMFGTAKHYLHRKVLPVERGLEVDHINGNKLDARRINLRAVTKAQNSQNRHNARKSASGILGVRYRSYAKKNPWLVDICVDKKRMFLGCYPTKEKAIEVRRAAELEHFGRYCPRPDIKQQLETRHGIKISLAGEETPQLEESNA